MSSFPLATTASYPTMSVELPEWLTAGDPVSPIELKPSQPVKSLAIRQFETVFPRVLEMMAAGYTLTAAVKEQPIDVDSGAFLRWIKKDPQRHELYKEAKEIRAEAWSDKLIQYSEASDNDEDVQRSKLKVDTLKWLMAADNRRTYGDVKSIELGGSISITAALAAAQQRVIEVIDATPRLTDDEKEAD